MKVKLLKKVRKRFSIVHMPNGFVFSLDGKHYDYNIFKLTDEKDSHGFRLSYAQLGLNTSETQQFASNIFYTEKDCIEFLKREIIDRLRNEGHRGRKDKMPELKERKVWYV